MSDAADESFQLSAAENESKEKFESAGQGAGTDMAVPEKESAESARYTKGSDDRKIGNAIVDKGLVTDRKVNIAISVDNTASIEEEAEKIRNFALQMGQNFQNLKYHRTPVLSVIEEQLREESVEQNKIILNFKIPNIYYEQFVSLLTGIG